MDKYIFFKAIDDFLMYLYWSIFLFTCFGLDFLFSVVWVVLFMPILFYQRPTRSCGRLGPTRAACSPCARCTVALFSVEAAKTARSSAGVWTWRPSRSARWTHTPPALYRSWSSQEASGWIVFLTWTNQIPENFGAVRTIADVDGQELLVGTTRNAILIGSISDGFRAIVQV